MTGGCPNHDYYVDDKSYCTPARFRELQEKSRRLREQMEAVNTRGGVQRALQEELDWRPDWGLDMEKQPFEANHVGCVAWPEAPELPQTCASLWGEFKF